MVESASFPRMRELRERRPDEKTNGTIQLRCQGQAANARVTCTNNGLAYQGRCSQGVQARHSGGGLEGGGALRASISGGRELHRGLLAIYRSLAFGAIRLDSALLHCCTATCKTGSWNRTATFTLRAKCVAIVSFISSPNAAAHFECISTAPTDQKTFYGTCSSGRNHMVRLPSNLHNLGSQLQFLHYPHLRMIGCRPLGVEKHSPKHSPITRLADLVTLGTLRSTNKLCGVLPLTACTHNAPPARKLWVHHNRLLASSLFGLALQRLETSAAWVSIID
ncbi:hypothetical protein NA56DRAFT_702023 [Hyaloscypha hepaticicola]|uniref:Uncharacterized protein n=1 Tax=Hyaloscypha hepaticicola TaxID=2082293 RepID=A0A2J6Q9I6_9HELO|nr:hypothetical protein NA56DRAFT_702023 [Hyaloscypha hepaticicola]